MEAIQNYQTVEQQYRQKYKQRLERQYKIGACPILTSYAAAVGVAAERRQVADLRMQLSRMRARRR